MKKVMGGCEDTGSSEEVSSYTDWDSEDGSTTYTLGSSHDTWDSHSEDKAFKMRVQMTARRRGQTRHDAETDDEDGDDSKTVSNKRTSERRRRRRRRKKRKGKRGSHHEGLKRRTSRSKRTPRKSWINDLRKTQETDGE